MSNANFIDFIKINCRSGNGGSGSSHFRRENLFLWADLMVGMEEKVEILF